MAESLEVLRGQRCRFLMYKSMFVETEREPGAGLPGDYGLFWCSHTQTCLGPDGGVIGDRECQAGRGCYEQL